MRAGTFSHGQGHQTAFAMIVSDQTGIPVDQIRLVDGDTELVPRGGGTGGSRSLQLGGSAVHRATEALVDKAKKLAAHLLEADVAFIQKPCTPLALARKIRSVLDAPAAARGPS